VVDSTAQREPHGGEDFGVLLGEIRALTTAYVKQRTLEPAKTIGRFVAVGAAGSMLLGGGLTLLALALLRALQTATGSTFHGHLSWLPYVVTAAVAVAVAGVAGLAVLRGRGPGKVGR
jgi:hypothetical protein